MTNRAGTVAISAESAALGSVFHRVDLGSGAVTSRPVPSAVAADARLIAVSDDAREVLLETAADGLVPFDMNARLDIYVLDLTSGTFDLIDQVPSGAPASAGASATGMSADGRFVVFQSISPDLVPVGGRGAVLVRDRAAGTTVRVDAAPAGVTIASAALGKIGADGRFVKFKARSPLGSVTDYVVDTATSAVVAVPFLDGLLSNDGRHVWGIGAAGDLQRFDVLAGTSETFASTVATRSLLVSVSDDERWVLYSAQVGAGAMFMQYEFDRLTGKIVPAASPDALGLVRQLAHNGDLVGAVANGSSLWRAAAGIPTVRIAPTTLPPNQTTVVTFDLSQRSRLLLPDAIEGRVPSGSPVTAAVTVDAAAAGTTQRVRAIGPTGCAVSVAVAILA